MNPQHISMETISPVRLSSGSRQLYFTSPASFGGSSIAFTLPFKAHTPYLRTEGLPSPEIMDKPAVPIGMRFGAEIECFIKLPDGVKLREIKDGHRMKFLGEKGQELFASSSLSVAYWLLAKYETWANGKQVFGIAVNPTDFWLKSEAKSLNKDQENEKYAKRKDCWGIELDGSLDSTVETLYKREICKYAAVKISSLATE